MCWYCRCCCISRRDLSTLEKVFEYFATSSQDGRKVMSAQDVVRALVPTYPPVGSTVERAGFLDGRFCWPQRQHSLQHHTKSGCGSADDQYSILDV